MASDRDEMNVPVLVCVHPRFEGTGWFFDGQRSYCWEESGEVSR